MLRLMSGAESACRSASRTSAIISTRCATHSIATKECQSDQASQRPHAKLWSNNGCVARECAGPQRALKSSSACEPWSSPKTGGTSSGKKSTSMVFPPFKNINNWPHPFRVLELLMRGAGQAQSREFLTEHVLGRTLSAYDRSIDTHISNLRRKLVDERGRGVEIRNIRGAALDR